MNAEEIMKLKIASSTFGIIVFLFASVVHVSAQFSSEVGDTLGKKNSSATASLIARLVQNQNNPPKTDSTNSSAVKFKPAADSGVAQALAAAFGAGAKQKAALVEAFRQIMQGYEAEVSKNGKSNNLAAAMTFFIAANVAAYGQTDLASEEAGEKLFQSLQEAMASVPAFAEMTDAEKHKMHDWLVCMAGFALTNYTDAKQSDDKEALANIKAFADYAIRLVLGIEASKLNISANGLNVQNKPSISSTTSQSVNNKIIGTWRKKSGSGSLNLVTNSGYHVSEYVFSPNGTYTFKSEMWLGYLRSEEWWTTEENGAFSVNGNTLTVSPRKSVATLRNRSSKVLKTQNNSLETTAYKWWLHYQEGTRETVLFLQPSAATQRDGGFNGFGDFPNSYVYDQSSVIEWKF